MPCELVARTYGDTMKIPIAATFRERYVTRQWFEVVCNTPEDFAASIRTEYERWDRLTKLSGVKVE
jgi:tripartite-type tricarboxylate transporter receptor subunit TctC